MNFTQEPRTMSLSSFRRSILSCWIDRIQNNPEIADKEFNPDGNKLSVLPAFPTDMEIKFILPCVVVSRITEKMGSGRNASLHGRFNQEVGGDTVESSVYAHRITAKYQFDLYTRDLPSQYEVAGYLDSIFQARDFDGGIGRFMVKDVTQRTTLSQPISELPDTDVYVYWRGYKDVDTMEIKRQVEGFEQLTYRLEFWSDLWYINNELSITSIDVDAEIVEEIGT